MTTWPHELMFAKCFELLGKKNGVFVGTLSCLQWHRHYSSFSSSSCPYCALPQLRAGPGSSKGQPHRSHCVLQPCRTGKDKVHTRQISFSRDAGEMEFRKSLMMLRVTAVERKAGSWPGLEEAIGTDRLICEDTSN